MNTETLVHEHSELADEAAILAGHPALDMLNTGGLTFDGQSFEYWRQDSDVAHWLVRVGLCKALPARIGEAGKLLASARQLREAVRELVRARKAGQVAEPMVLNRFLRRAVSHQQLLWSDTEGPQLVRMLDIQGPEQSLLLLAEAAAELLVQLNFDLVRQCEHEQCVYWFYDQTKGHKRRWCSMALCGNRYKVARYRERKGG